MENVENLSNYLWEYVLLYGPRLVAAILTLLVGLWIVGILTKVINKLLNKKQIDPSLTPFLRGLFSGLLKILLIISVLGMLGIEMTSFIAIIGSMGLAIGLALSGSLQNFAGGIILLIFKPFKVGDFITAQGHSGTVEAISIMHTILKSPQNETIIIPNGSLSNDSIVNFSSEQLRRVDWVFGVGYGDNTEKTKKILNELLNSDERILKDPASVIALQQLGDSSVNFVVRAWVENSQFWPVFFSMNEKVYKTFEEEGLNIPYPQMDIHLHKNN